MTAAQTVRIGTHIVELSEDLAIIRWIGQPLMSDIQGVFNLVNQVHAAHPRFFIAADMRHSLIPEATARRWAMEWLRDHQPVAFACFGSNVAIRTVLSLMLNAIRFLGSQQPPTLFCQTEAEARAYLGRQGSLAIRPPR